MVDINCDMGEGMANDGLLIPFISSANIACGYHAGNNSTIRNTIELCLKHEVAIGIHPSFKDRQNFGRTEMQLADMELFDLVSEQLHSFSSIAVRLDAQIHHVKPHGALYNMAAKDNRMAAIIAKAVFGFNSRLVLYGLADSCLVSEAAAIGLKTASEAFADRSYQADGSLTPRSKINALHTSEEIVVKQVLQIVKDHSVFTANGETIPLIANTICIHGGGDHALRFAKAIHHALKQNGISIAPV
jgi:UPF0271 protein